MPTRVVHNQPAGCFVVLDKGSDWFVDLVTQTLANLSCPSETSLRELSDRSSLKVWPDDSTGTYHALIDRDNKIDQHGQNSKFFVHHQRYRGTWRDLSAMLLEHYLVHVNCSRHAPRGRGRKGKNSTLGGVP